MIYNRIEYKLVSQDTLDIGVKMPFEIKFNKFGEPNYPYIYEILHKPTGSVYVGSSAANKRYQNGYWGSASGKSNQLMHRQTILKNIHDYQKTILMYFETYNEVAEYEKKKIKEYLKEYGNLCLNRNVGGVLKPTKEQASAAGKKGGAKGGIKGKNKVYIHKDGIQTNCRKDELEQKLSEGWIEGRTEEWIENQRIAQTQPDVNKSRSEKQKHVQQNMTEAQKQNRNQTVSDSYDEKRRQEYSDRFSGDKNPSKRPEVKEKIKKTNIERWDDDLREEHSNKTKEAMQRPEVKERQEKGRREQIANRTEDQKALAKLNPEVVSRNHASSGIKYKSYPKPTEQQINDFINLFNKTFSH